MASSCGMGIAVVGDNDDYGNLDPNLFCVVALVYVSGDDVVETAAQEQFFQNFSGTVISVHSGPDAERHPSITSCNAADASAYFAQSIIGASLRNGGCNQKHDCNGSAEVIYKDPAQTAHPLAIGLPDSVQLDDIELYYVGATISGTYWNPGNIVIWRAMEDGPGSEDIPVMWITPEGHITLTLGHFSQISQPGEISYILLNRMWDYAIQTCAAGPIFNLTLEDLMQEPDPLDPIDNSPYRILNMNGQIIEEGTVFRYEPGKYVPGTYVIYRGGIGQKFQVKP